MSSESSENTEKNLLKTEPEKSEELLANIIKEQERLTILRKQIEENSSLREELNSKSTRALNRLGELTINAKHEIQILKNETGELETILLAIEAHQKRIAQIKPFDWQNSDLTAFYAKAQSMLNEAQRDYEDAIHHQKKLTRAKLEISNWQNPSRNSEIISLIVKGFYSHLSLILTILVALIVYLATR